jgi:type II secretory pathway component GspD/PulD (secretin)
LERTVIIASVLTFITIVAGAPLNAQRSDSVFLQIEALELPLQDNISGINLTATPLRDVLSAITKANGFSFRFAPTIESLDTLCTVNLTGGTVERALTQILEPNKLAFVATRYRVFIFPNTPVERQKYAQSIREFKILNGDPNKILMILNQALARPDKSLVMEPDGQRPAIASNSGSQAIIVRATADVMDRIAKIIAENDK